MAMRPKFSRSGYPGWAPTRTPRARASATVSSITDGSPAWKPHATLAEVKNGSNAASSRPSPTSALMSTMQNDPNPAGSDSGSLPGSRGGKRFAESHLEKAKGRAGQRPRDQREVGLDDRGDSG